MVGRGNVSAELRRLGRAGPNAGEMELLRAATLPDDRAAWAWQRWRAAHDIEVAHHRSIDLLPAVSANVPAGALATEADRLRGMRRRVWADDQLHLATLLDAVRSLQAVGLDPVVCKGAALATTVYTEPGTRAMADVDLLIGDADFERARDVLLDAGWSRLDPVEGPFFHAVAVVDGRGRGVDVHRWVVFPRFSPVPERSWLERAVPHSIRGVGLRRLAGSDELVLTVLHGLLTNSASASRWPVDVVRLTRCGAGDVGFWERVVASAGELQTGAVVADALAMCRVELDAPVPEEAVDALRATPLDRGLAMHWALCRRGVTPEWRIRRYVRLERAAGRRPTVAGYVRPRTAAIRTRGLGSVVEGRIERVKQIVADRTRGV